MPKSKTTWSQDEIEDLVREYLWKSGLRPVEKTDEGSTDSKKRKPKTFQWGFKPRVSLTTEVEPDPAFEEGEQVARCHNCGHIVRVHQRELPRIADPRGVESGRLDASQPNESAAPREQDDEDDPEPVDIPLDPKLMPEGSAQALETAQKAQKEKEKREQQEIARKRKKMRGESGKRPY